MALTREQMLASMYERRRADDGRFLVCVRTTRIYCLPSCPARKPKAENVEFVRAPAEAAARGYRACLRCRPDVVYSGVDPIRGQLTRAVDALRAHPADVPDVASLARRAGFGVTRLNNLCREHYHLSPGTLMLRTRTLAAAEALATGTRTADAGYEVGFASNTAYYQNFRQYLGLSPGEYRALATHQGRRGEALTFALTLPAGFATAPLRHLMNRDPSAACERVLASDAQGLILERGVRHGEGPACVLRLEVRGREARVRVTPRSGEGPCNGATGLAAHRVVQRLLGFESHLPSLRARAARPEGAWMAPLLARHPGLRVPLMASPYEALIWAVLGQQVNLTFAGQLRAELIRLAHGDRDGADAQLLPHPTPAQVARLDPQDLQTRRFSRSKSTWVVALSDAVARGHLDLRALARGPAAQAHETLVAQKGVGDWTAQYVMLRGMGYNDCVPAADAGLMRNLQGVTGAAHRPRAEDVARALAPLAPARSVACQHLWAWQAESDGKEKQRANG